ncbi:DUF6680 family protein [Limibacillus halophilus]
MNDSLWIGAATIVAVLVGPILAVFVSKFNDDRRAAYFRRVDIFKTLMRTRRMPIHYDHVGALNLVEVEFDKYPQVINAWKKYLSNLSEKTPDINEQDRRESFLKKRNNLLIRLISEIAKSLKIKVEQLDILEGNYVPQGWEDEQWEQRVARMHLISVLSGKSPIYVNAFQKNHLSNPYPPPPSDS